MAERIAACIGSSRELRLDPHALPTRFRAADANADGQVRLVEVHHEPEKALSDGVQSIIPTEFATLTDEVRGIANVLHRKIN